MNDSASPEDRPADASREEVMSALFANLVLSQTNLALMMLGKVPHPETGERFNDAESARLFIDQLEMIEFKTKGNLDKQEQALLKQALTNLRMAFVETVEQQESPPAAPGEPAKTAAAPPAAATAGPPPAPASDEGDSPKRFSKKY